MFAQTVKNNKYWKILLLVGVITLVFGLIIYNAISIESRNISLLKGMIIGLGSAFTAISGIKLVQNKMTPAEKLKAKEIELNDERHIAILRISLSIASASATVLFAVLAFAFVAMNDIVPGFMSLGAMYLQLLAFFLAHKYYSNKM